MQETQHAAGTALEQPSGPETQNQQLAVLPADMTPEVFKARIEREKQMRDILGEYVKSQMKEDHHFSKKLGTLTLPKPMLLQEGVRNICSLFKLFFGEPVVREEYFDGDHYRARVHIKLYNAQGNQIASGDAICSTYETKYAFRTGERECPKCHQPTIFKDNKTQDGGWYCWAKKGGCGAKFNSGDQEIESQKIGRVDNPDKADVHNTVLKIGIKRAKSSAVCDVAMVSEIFAPEGDAPGAGTGNGNDSNQPPAKAKGTNKGEHVPEQTTSPAPPNNGPETAVSVVVGLVGKLLERGVTLDELTEMHLPGGVARFEDLTEEQAIEIRPDLAALLTAKVKGN